MSRSICGTIAAPPFSLTVATSPSLHYGRLHRSTIADGLAGRLASQLWSQRHRPRRGWYSGPRWSLAETLEGGQSAVREDPAGSRRRSRQRSDTHERTPFGAMHRQVGPTMDQALCELLEPHGAPTHTSPCRPAGSCQLVLGLRDRGRVDGSRNRPMALFQQPEIVMTSSLSSPATTSAARPPDVSKSDNNKEMP